VNGWDVLEVSDLLIVAKLRGVVCAEFRRILKGIRMPIGIKIDQRSKRPFIQPACLYGGMGFLLNRPGGHHHIAAGYRFPRGFYRDHFKVKPVPYLFGISVQCILVHVICHHAF